MTFAAESATGWQEAAFSSPVDRPAGHHVHRLVPHGAGNYATGTSFASAGVDTPAPPCAPEGVEGRTASTLWRPAGCSRPTSWQSSNYLVDVLFTPTAPQDETAPSITATTPAANATGSNRDADVSATFSEAIDPATVSTSTSSNSATPQASSCRRRSRYNAATRRAALNPSAELAAGTRYTATIKGGDERRRRRGGQPTRWRRHVGVSEPPVTTPPHPSSRAHDSDRRCHGSRHRRERDRRLQRGHGPGLDQRVDDRAPRRSRQPVAATVAYDAATATAVLDPNQPLTVAIKHTVTVKGGAERRAGRHRGSTAGELQFELHDRGPRQLAAGRDRDLAARGTPPTSASRRTSRRSSASRWRLAAINGTTVQLRDASGNLVNAVVTYDPGTKAAVIDPVAPLVYSAEYTVTLAGRRRAA